MVAGWALGYRGDVRAKIENHDPRITMKPAFGKSNEVRLAAVRLDGAVRAAASGTLLLLCVQTSAGQTAEAKNASGAKEAEINLSSFEVVTTKDHGYVATNAASALKTNQELMKVPQAVNVVTRDLIEDIGGFNTSDVLRFAGVATYFRGEAVSLRGVRIGYPMLDEMAESAPFLDNVGVDSYEIVKGPSSVLYGNRASLSGLILKSSKKPLPVAQRSIVAKVDQFGTYRSELDLTGPVARLGEGTFSYRLVGAYQDGDTYFKNAQDKRKVVSPTFQFGTDRTTVRVQLDTQYITKEAQANNFLTPDGELYTGAGRDEKYLAPWNKEDSHRLAARVALLHKISDGWDMKLQAGVLQFDRYGSVNSMPQVNWPAQTVTTTYKRNDIQTSIYSGVADFGGHYEIGGIRMQTNLGAYIDNRTSITRSWYSPTFVAVTRSISDPNFDTIAEPTDVVRAANPGNRSDEWVGNAYFQQTADLIRDRLTVVAGGSYSSSDTKSLSNLASSAVSITKGDEWLRRVGVIFNPIKDVALYAMDSTTFTPVSGSTLDINGNLLGNNKGEGKEAGIKLAFLGGRVSSTVSVFQIDLTNVAILAGSVGTPSRGYYESIGSTKQKGFDFDFAVSPVDGLQFIFGGYFGDVTDQTGARVANTYKSSENAFVRYDFRAGALKGLAIGAGAFYMGDRLIPTVNYVLPAGQTTLTMKAYTTFNAFVSYTTGSWSGRLNVENLTDEIYPLGSQHATCIDPSNPRTVSLSLQFRF